MLKITKSLEDFEKISKDFLDKIFKKKLKIKDGDTATVVGLFGDLGAGKTTFVQNIAKDLGIKQKINSPTFVLLKRYPFPRASLGKSKWDNVYHIDAYRLEGKDIKKELEILGWNEIISNPKNLVFVEWPEILKDFMPSKYNIIFISHTKNNQRKFEFKML
jgi:tRNA threonylcarbamoyladenosine biosynthesis protein TsaE